MTNLLFSRSHFWIATLRCALSRISRKRAYSAGVVPLSEATSVPQ